MKILLEFRLKFFYSFRLIRSYNSNLPKDESGSVLRRCLVTLLQKIIYYLKMYGTPEILG